MRTILHWIRYLDRLLRGEVTRAAAIRTGEIDLPIGGFLVLVSALGMIYGLCMGVFSITPGGSHHAMQLLATLLKVPALFLLTLLVTFPSLYVFNALIGSPLMIGAVVRMLIAFLAVMLATLASIGPIVAFFSFTTTSYEFMVLLNVLVFSVAGFLGLAFLLQTMNRINIAMSLWLADQHAVPVPTYERPATTQTEAGNVSPSSGPLFHPFPQAITPRAKRVFQVWVAVFGLVGAQMAWVLRPFIGHPNQDFAWFRHPYSNFFQAVLEAAQKLL